MIKNKPIFTRENIDPDLRDLSTWATVDPTLLTDKDAQIFKRRQGAVFSYFSNQYMETISAEFGISRQEILRNVKRCLEQHPDDGRIWGFRALIPYTRQKDYERTAPPTKSTDPF